jgi:hypothetical protein
MHSFVPECIHSFEECIHSFEECIHSVENAFIRSRMHSFIRGMDSFIQSRMHSVENAFIHSRCNHASIRECINSFVCLSVCLSVCPSPTRVVKVPGRRHQGRGRSWRRRRGGAGGAFSWASSGKGRPAWSGGRSGGGCPPLGEEERGRG